MFYCPDCQGAGTRAPHTDRRWPARSERQIGDGQGTLGGRLRAWRYHYVRAAVPPRACLDGEGQYDYPGFTPKETKITELAQGNAAVQVKSKLIIFQ